LIHHCLEIPTGTSTGQSLLTHGLHKVLAGGYRLIDHLILQDQQRARLFFCTFPYLKDLPYHLVSNSFINEIEPLAVSLNWFDELRAQSRYLILYTGTIEPWAVSKELIQRVVDFPEVTFLFSGWSRDGYADALAARYRSASNIHFHLGAKNRSGFNYMVANSDAGLVWYESVDQNVSHVGLSSGKMHKFLSFERPILTNGISSLHDFVTDNGFGVSVTDGNIHAAIRRLIDNRLTIAKNIRSRYSALCNYEREYMAFIHDILNCPQMPAIVATPAEASAC
jgi:hypothetical protein